MKCDMTSTMQEVNH